MASYITYGNTYYGFWKVGLLTSDNRKYGYESSDGKDEQGRPNPVGNNLSTTSFPSDKNYYFFIITKNEDLTPLERPYPALLTDYTSMRPEGEEDFEVEDIHAGCWFSYTNIWNGSVPSQEPANDPPPGTTPSSTTYQLTYKDVKIGTANPANPSSSDYEQVLTGCYSTYPTVGHRNFNNYNFLGYYTAITDGTKITPGSAVSSSNGYIYWARYIKTTTENLPTTTHTLTIYPNGSNCSFRIQVGGYWKGTISTDENGFVSSANFTTEYIHNNYSMSQISFNNENGPHITFSGLNSAGGIVFQLGNLQRIGYNFNNFSTNIPPTSQATPEDGWAYKWFVGDAKYSIQLNWLIKQYNVNVVAFINNGPKSNFTVSNLYNNIKLKDFFDFTITNVKNSTPDSSTNGASSYAYFTATYKADYGQNISLTNIHLNLTSVFKDRYFVESYIPSGHYPIPFIYKGNTSLNYTVTSNITIPLYITFCSVPIYTSSGFKNAIPYIYDGTKWKPTIAYVYNGGFKPSKYDDTR